MKNVENEKEKVVKLNSKEFKDQIDKFSKENNISKRQARKKIFWQSIEFQKMSESESTKNVFKAKNASFSKTQQSSQSNQTRSEINKQTKFSKVSETNKTRDFSKRSNSNQKVIQRQSFKSKVDTSYAYSYVTKPKVDFVPQKPNFPNYTKKETMRTYREKGMTSRKNVDHWLEGKGKIYQSNKYSKEQIHEAYEKYVNTSSNSSSSSKDSNISVKVWRPVTKAKTVQSLTQEAKGNVSEHSKLSNTYVSVSLDDEINLIDSLKTKVCDWVKSSSLHAMLKSNFQGPNKPWVPKFFHLV